MPWMGSPAGKTGFRHSRGFYVVPRPVQPRFRIVYLAALAFLALTAVEQHLRADQQATFPSEQLEADRPLRIVSEKTADLLIPVAGVEKTALRNDWGDIRGGGARRHTAIDILAPRGTRALACVSGSIMKLHDSPAGGHTLYLVDETRSRIYYYAHLDKYADGIEAGVKVAQGDVIGFVGSTGNAPETTPHLHFGIERMPATGEWWKGEPINPYPILVDQGRTVP